MIKHGKNAEYKCAIQSMHTYCEGHYTTNRLGSDCVNKASIKYWTYIFENCTATVSSLNSYTLALAGPLATEETMLKQHKSVLKRQD